MQLNPLQSESQDSKPPSIFQPVLGQGKNQQTIHISCSFKSSQQQTSIILDLYDDRVVGRVDDSSYFFLLTEEIYFDIQGNDQELLFRNRQTGQTELFITENLFDLKHFCVQLKTFCAQTNFDSKYQITEQIAKRKNSEVYKVVHRNSGKIYAVKRCLNNSSLQKQLAILRQLKHPNLIFFQQFFIEEDHTVLIVMDYEDGGNLLDLIRSNEMTNKLSYKLLKDTLSGLQLLRIKGIVHRDLKPENILYSKTEGNFKIADFELAVRENELQNKIVGTPGYISPQLFDHSKGKSIRASIYMDIYSAGLIFYQALTSARFYEANTKEELLKKNMKCLSYKSSSKDQINKLEGNILRRMIRRNPQDRKNSYQIMQCKYFNNLNKVHVLDIQSISTESPEKRNEMEKEQENLFMAVKYLLKIRSSSN